MRLHQDHYNLYSYLCITFFLVFTSYSQGENKSNMFYKSMYDKLQKGKATLVYNRSQYHVVLLSNTQEIEGEYNTTLKIEDLKSLGVEVTEKQFFSYSDKIIVKATAKTHLLIYKKLQKAVIKPFSVEVENALVKFIELDCFNFLVKVDKNPKLKVFFNFDYDVLACIFTNLNEESDEKLRKVIKKLNTKE